MDKRTLTDKEERRLWNWLSLEQDGVHWPALGRMFDIAKELAELPVDFTPADERADHGQVWMYTFNGKGEHGVWKQLISSGKMCSGEITCSSS